MKEQKDFFYEQLENSKKIINLIFADSSNSEEKISNCLNEIIRISKFLDAFSIEVKWLNIWNEDFSLVYFYNYQDNIFEGIAELKTSSKKSVSDHIKLYFDSSKVNKDFRQQNLMSLRKYLSSLNFSDDIMVFRKEAVKPLYPVHFNVKVENNLGNNLDSHIVCRSSFNLIHYNDFLKNCKYLGKFDNHVVDSLGDDYKRKLQNWIFWLYNLYDANIWEYSIYIDGLSPFYYSHNESDDFLSQTILYSNIGVQIKDKTTDIEIKHGIITDFIWFCKETLSKLSSLIELEYIRNKYRYTQTRSAINSILIDSYAHNISAHSLNFLQQLFSYRNENFLKKHIHIPQFNRLENLSLNSISYSQLFDANMQHKGKDSSLEYYEAQGLSDSTNTIFDTNILDYLLYNTNFKDKDDKEIKANDLLKYSNGEGKLPMPLDYAIAPLLTYLRDKGAFWSGVIRDNKATPSQIVSMYDLLMEMFRNPLFIGSIMAAEEFFLLHVFINMKGTEQLDSKHFLTINLKDFVRDEMGNIGVENDDKVEYDTLLNNKNVSNLNFVRFTTQHSDLRTTLEKMTVLMPGGIVGKHAFFTIVENTLRNAKHIINNHRNDIKKNGLELHFQIEECNFELNQNNTTNNSESGASEKELYQIGINVNYRKETDNQLSYNFGSKSLSNEEEQKLVSSVIKSSYKAILTDDGQPRMGGSSQDKVCAAALFNKTFTSAEYEHNDVSHYYPWVAYNVYPDTPDFTKKNEIYDTKLRSKSKEEIRDFLNNKSEIDKLNTPSLLITFKKQLYIKLFHIWKAKEVEIYNNELKDSDNDGESKFIDTIPRYKIAVVKDVNSKMVLRKRAFVRVLVKENTNTETKFEDYYNEWNKGWLLGNIKTQGIKLSKDNTEIIFKIDAKEKSAILIDGNSTKSEILNIKVSHDKGAEAGDICKLRNHGYFLKHICKNITSDKLTQKETPVEIDPEKEQELLETVLTKIFIVDNRLYNLIDMYTFEDKKDKKKDGILKTLGLNIQNEEKDIYGIKQVIKDDKWEIKHFFIFHLSYVDDLIKKDSEFQKAPKPIDAFIEKLLGKNISDNTIIGMTTGRGREDWLNRTEKYRANCIHIPIESLQTAIQQGINFKDDFDIKYNLCKVLFGS